VTTRADTVSSVIEPLSIGEVAQRILVIRGQRVLLDADLAKFYGESTKRLNQQVNRNRQRFPEDFMFQLSDEEFASLRLQSATSSSAHGGRRYAPLAFTEHGAIMASMVLNSERATGLSVYVVRPSSNCAGCWHPTRNWPPRSTRWSARSRCMSATSQSWPTRWPNCWPSQHRRRSGPLGSSTLRTRAKRLEGRQNSRPDPRGLTPGAAMTPRTLARSVLPNFAKASSLPT